MFSPLNTIAHARKRQRRPRQFPMARLPSSAAAGGALPADLALDGKDLLPCLRGQDFGPVHETLFWCYPGKNEGKWWAVRRGDSKLLGTGDDKTGLYDLGRDPGESANRLGEQPDVASRLQQAFTAWKARLAPEYKYKLKK